jgi:Replication-relaxation
MAHGDGRISPVHIFLMKTTNKADALNRRSRFSGRQPTGKRIILGERDFAILAALERHGPLPSTYLYEFAKHLARNYKGHQQRLTDLYNEDNTPHRGFYLHRPEQQYASINARYQPMSYEITERGRQALRDKAIPRQMWQPPNGPYLHRFMTSCITASIELATRESGLRYLSQADIFGHPKCPACLVATDNPLALHYAAGAVIPDALFGIDYGGKFRFFALEADRKTETIVSEKSRSKSFIKKLESYIQVLEQQSYRGVWGVPTLTILTVTTSEQHMKTMIGELRRLTESRVSACFLFKVNLNFGKYWSVPGLMPESFSNHWQRVGVEMTIAK